jgi:hypothetical protein
VILGFLGRAFRMGGEAATVAQPVGLSSPLARPPATAGGLANTFTGPQKRVVVVVYIIQID